MSMMRFFHEYVKMGFQPIAIYRNTKQPAEKNWNKSWSEDRWSPYFVSSEFNMGILLGRFVDVEGDTPEANEFLQNIIGDLPCPRFRSSKSVHYLFKNPDPNLTRRVIEGVEFRAHMHQSVVPPSTHESGVPYGWLRISKFPPPAMPAKLLEFYIQHQKIKEKKISRQRKKPLQRGCKLTECNDCLNKFPIHRSRLLLEVQGFRKCGQKWLCHICRRNRQIDLRDFCRDLRKIQHQEEMKSKRFA
jgi:hypothetical protein